MISFNNVKVKSVSEDKSNGEFVISGLPTGYGNTLGVSLRRVLLASMEGSVITEVKIKGVSHEFSSIPGIKEGVYEILLNLKKIRFRLNSGDNAEAELILNKSGKITAKDVSVPGNLKISNPKVVICEVSKLKKEIKLRLKVEKGIGYKAVGLVDRNEIGVIPLDADFSPIRRVKYKVTEERASGEEMNDKLNLVLQTDGSITPTDALKRAFEIINNLMLSVSRFFDGEFEVEVQKSPEITEEETVEIKWDLSMLSLSNKTINALKRNDVETLENLLSKTEKEIMDLQGIGKKITSEITGALKANGLSLK